MADIAQPGLVKQFVDKGALKPITLRAARRCSRTSHRRGSRSARSTSKIYGLVFKASNKSTVWYNAPRVQERGRQGAGDLAAAHLGREHDQGVGRAAVLDRRRRRLDAHRPVREHLPPAGGAGEVRAAHRRTRSSGRIRRSRGAEDDGRRCSATRRTWPAAPRARCRRTSRPRSTTSSRTRRRRRW